MRDMGRKTALALSLRQRCWPIHNRCTAFAQMKMTISTYLSGSNSWRTKNRTPICTTLPQPFPEDYHSINLINSAFYGEKTLVWHSLLGLDSSLVVARTPM